MTEQSSGCAGCGKQLDENDFCSICGDAVPDAANRMVEFLGLEFVVCTKCEAKEAEKNHG